MLQVQNINELTAQIREWKHQRKTIAFVPTMGNLHKGHLSLIAQGHQQADKLVSSIFVNPMQFAPEEDLDNYPRTLQKDCKVLMEHGCDLVYLPKDQDLYPRGLSHMTAIQVPDVTCCFEGEHRPGHLTGVSTIVLKLFNLVQPNIAVFGKKDYQQFQMVRKMVLDLNLNIDIIGGETIRETDGLAMSSRNQYLSPDERQQAITLYHQLIHAAKQYRVEGSDFEPIKQQAIQALTAAGFKVDYFDLCGQQTLIPVNARKSSVIVAAAKLGATRLIDNIEI